jgi:NAD(P)-dependent dehydrogenase (short-subunit alcohol dehydrogenase family)
MACNLSDLASIPAFIEKIINEFGQIDILVNNAGINMKKEFTEVTDEEFQNIITTNLCAVFSISREVVKYMLEKRLRKYYQHQFHGSTIRLTKSNCLYCQ